MKKKWIVLLTLLPILLTACNSTSSVNELLEEMEEVERYDALSGLDLLKYEDLNFEVKYPDGNGFANQSFLINKIVATVIRLDLEFVISKNDEANDVDNQFEVQFFPTNKTLEIIERWEEAHKNNPEIPYPTSDIEQENWMEVGEHLKELELQFGTEMADEIVDG